MDLLAHLARLAPLQPHVRTALAMSVLGLPQRRRQIPRICIVTAGRCGSELLVDFINSHPQICCESEILTMSPPNPYLYIRGRTQWAARRGALAYGFKIAAIQLEFPRFIPLPNELFTRLEDDGTTFVRIRRRSLLLQALSHVRSQKTRVFHVRSDAARPKAIAADPVAVVAMMQWIEEHESILDKALDGVEVRELVYEDDISNPARLAAVGRDLCTTVGLTSYELSSTFVRTGGTSVADDFQNLDEIVRLVAQTRFAPELAAIGR